MVNNDVNFCQSLDSFFTVLNLNKSGNQIDYVYSGIEAVKKVTTALVNNINCASSSLGYVKDSTCQEAFSKRSSTGSHIRPFYPDPLYKLIIIDCDLPLSDGFSTACSIQRLCTEWSHIGSYKPHIIGVSE